MGARETVDQYTEGRRKQWNRGSGCQSHWLGFSGNFAYGVRFLLLIPIDVYPVKIQTPSKLLNYVQAEYLSDWSSNHCPESEYFF